MTFFVLVAVALPLVLVAFSRVAVLVIKRMYPPETLRLVVDGIGVNVVIRPGPPGAETLLMIHGASGNWREPMAALGDALSGRFRVIAIDRPGSGYTARGARGNSNPQRQAALIAATLDELGVARCLVFGHSLGGAVALALALARPDLVAGLVLAAPASHPWPGGISRRTRFFAGSALGRVLAELLVVPLGLILMRPAISAIFRPEPVAPSYARRIGAALAIRPASFIATSRDVAELKANLERIAPRYSSLTMPVEIVAGERDIIVSTSIHAKALAREIPDARLTLLPTAGHMPHWTHPHAVLAALDRVAASAVPLRETLSG